MKFNEEFELDFSPEEISKCMVEPETLRYIEEHHPEIKKLELLEDKTEGNTRNIRIRYIMDVPVPDAIKKILKAEPNSFVIHLVINTVDHSSTFEVLPDIMADKFKGSGKVYAKPKGDKWIQYMEGEIKVKFLGVGGMMEKMAIGRAKESFGQEVKIRNEYMKKRFGKG